MILNPFDGDARKWNLFGEITNDYDVEQLARSLIPDSGDPDRTWTEYARTFFSAVVQQAIAAGARDDGELYRLLNSAPVEELRVLLAGTAAGPFLEPGNEKMFGSVRSIASSAARALKYTTRQQATPFSVRQWVRQGASRAAGGQGGVLFFPYKAGEIAALRSVISAWMRIAIFEAMDRDEGDQRLWFVIDELDALGEIDGLKDALARLRKFGGRCILGFQSIAQVSGTYGKGIAETIVENCGNTFIFRCSASEHGGTSEFASKLIGQREVVHTTLSKTRRPDEWLPSTTTESAPQDRARRHGLGDRASAGSRRLSQARLGPGLAGGETHSDDASPAPVRPRKPGVVASPSISVTASPAASSPAAARRPAAATPAVPRRRRQAKAATRRGPVPPRETTAPYAMPPEIAKPPAIAASPEIAARAEDVARVENSPGGAEWRN